MKQYDVTVETVLGELKEFSKMIEKDHVEVKHLKELENKDEASLDIHSPEFLRKT